MQRCNDLLIAGIKTYGGLTSYLGNPDGGRSLLSELQLHLFYIEKQGLAMRQGKKDGAVAALLRNHPTFWPSHPARGHLGAQL